MSDQRKLIYGCDYERIPDEFGDVSGYGDFWHKFDLAKKYLLPFEKRILELLFLGHGPSSIAQIVDFNTRQHGLKFIQNIVRITKFFCEHGETIEKMHIWFDSDKDYELVVNLLVRRHPYKWIAIDNDRCIGWVGYRLRQIAIAHNELEDMIKAYMSLSVLRSWWSYYMWREKFKEYILKLQEQGVWYEWAGQNVKKGVADCSGLVIDVFKNIGVYPDSFKDKTANGLSDLYDETDEPESGDLVFYGKSWNEVSHVMFYWGILNDGKKDLPGKYCIGMAGGGGRRTKKWHGQKFGIGLWFRKLIYRRDYLGTKKVTDR